MRGDDEGAAHWSALVRNHRCFSYQGVYTAYAEFVTDDPMCFMIFTVINILNPLRIWLSQDNSQPTPLPRFIGHRVILFPHPGSLLNMFLVTIVIQFLLSCLTVYFGFWDRDPCVRPCPNSNTMCGVYAIDPLSVIFSSLIMPETFSTLALSLFLCFSSDTCRRNRWFVSLAAMRWPRLLRTSHSYFTCLDRVVLAFFAINKKVRHTRLACLFS